MSYICAPSHELYEIIKNKINRLLVAHCIVFSVPCFQQLKQSKQLKLVSTVKLSCKMLTSIENLTHANVTLCITYDFCLCSFLHFLYFLDFLHFSTSSFGGCQSCCTFFKPAISNDLSKNIDIFTFLFI